MTDRETRDFLHQRATDLGFQCCAVTSAQPAERSDYYRSWLARGRAGKMDYLQRHVPQRLDPERLLPGARSVILVALSYHQPEVSTDSESAGQGRVAMYAWGRDYHRVIKKKLHTLVDDLRQRLGQPFDAKVCVDTAPLLEREFAMRAGVGWIGKNTLVLNTRLGSYFFLGAVVTTLDLPLDPPATDHCGSCTRCLDACPTDAFPQPYQMDASRCISYLTIECRDEALPADLAEQVGSWVFGCDICQEVCPFNDGAAAMTEPDLPFARPVPGRRSTTC